MDHRTVRFAMYFVPLLFYPPLVNSAWSNLCELVPLLINLAFKLLWSTILSAPFLVKDLFKALFLLAHFALDSYCRIGRTFLSVVNHVPAKLAEVCVSTLLIWLGNKLVGVGYEINQKIRTVDDADFWQVAWSVIGHKLKPTGIYTSYGASTDPPGPPAVTNAHTNTEINTDNETDIEIDPEIHALKASISVLKESINGALEELTCPITFDLPVDPVVTDGGDVVERDGITALIRQTVWPNSLRSMRTNQPMGTRIVDAVAIRNAIEKLVDSGAVEADVATAWKKGRKELEGRRGNDAPLGLLGWEERMEGIRRRGNDVPLGHLGGEERMRLVQEGMEGIRQFLEGDD